MSSHYFNLAFDCDWLFALDQGKTEIRRTHYLLSPLEKSDFWNWQP